MSGNPAYVGQENHEKIILTEIREKEDRYKQSEKRYVSQKAVFYAHRRRTYCDSSDTLKTLL